MTRARRLFSPYLTFLTLTIAISAIASALARTGNRTLELAATLDLTITVTFCYYWLLVRPGLRSAKTLGFIAVLGLWRAAFLFPQVVPGKLWIGGLAELAVITILWRSLRAIGDNDPLLQLRTTLATFIPVPTAVRLIASETAILYYGLFSWRARPHVTPNSQPFTMHEKTSAGVLFYCMAGVSLLEVGPVHLLVNRWSHTAAWIVTALSLYGLIWMLAMARAFHLRPTLVGPDGITVRCGMLFSLHIPAGKIRSLSTQADNALIIPRNTLPSLYVEFTEPLDAEGILGITKRVTALGLSPDNPAAFRTALLGLL